MWLEIIVNIMSKTNIIQINATISKHTFRSICVASSQLHQESAQNSPELWLSKYFPSTYTITAISWLPPLISQLFALTILNGAAPFFTARIFEINLYIYRI